MFIPQNGFAEGIEFTSMNPKLFKMLVHAVDDNPELVKSSFELTKRVYKKTSKSLRLQRCQKISFFMYLKKILTIKLSFISLIRFQIQINMNFKE